MSKRFERGIRPSHEAALGALAPKLLTDPAYRRALRRRLRAGTLSPSIERELYRSADEHASTPWPIRFVTQHRIGGNYDPMGKSPDSQPSTAPATTNPEDDGNPDDLVPV